MLVMQASKKTFTEAAVRSASRVHPLLPLGGTPPRATAMSHIRQLNQNGNNISDSGRDADRS
jgi:hypothetical protein